MQVYVEKRSHRPKIHLTPQITAYLKDNCSTVTIHEMAKKLGVSHSKVQSWRRELNLLGTRAEALSRTSKIEMYSDYFNWDTVGRLDFIFRQDKDMDRRVNTSKKNKN